MLRKPSLSILLVTFASYSACGGDPPCPGGANQVGGICIIGSACYLDRDRDGVGAGKPLACDAAPKPGANEMGDVDAARADAGPMTDAPVVAARGGDCDDRDPSRAPGFKELCDAIDNDCDGIADNAASNACGGDCSLILPHAPGEACDNGLVGACRLKGAYVCEGRGAVRCDAPAAMPAAERCGDNIDNDCDGHVDESDAGDAATWYRDCDEDGYASSVLK